LVVSLEAFEEQLKPYLDMASARKYRDLMRQFVDVAQAKNGKQVELTQIAIQISRDQSELLSRSLEADRVSQLVANANNPALTEAAVFIGRFLEQVKRQILRVTDLQRRGLRARPKMILGDFSGLCFSVVCEDDGGSDGLD
jgi:hypothetical protein